MLLNEVPDEGTVDGGGVRHFEECFSGCGLRTSARGYRLSVLLLGRVHRPAEYLHAVASPLDLVPKEHEMLVRLFLIVTSPEYPQALRVE